MEKKVVLFSFVYGKTATINSLALKFFENIIKNI